MLEISLQILVASARYGQHNHIFRLEQMFHLWKHCQGMTRFESRDDTFHSRKFERCPQSLIVVDWHHLGATCLIEVAMYRTRARVVETSRD